MVKDHKKDVAEFQKKHRLENGAIRAFAAKHFHFAGSSKTGPEIKDLSDRSVATVPVPNAPKYDISTDRRNK
jgi:hypothetical protein